MNKYIMILMTVLFTAFTGNAFAYTVPDKPTNGWYIVDQAGKLTEDQKTQLNTKIDNLNKSTKNEFGVLIVNSLDGDDIEDAAQNTFRTWGIGKAGLDNGILLMISVGDRKTRLQTGKGVEGELPDLKCSDILANELKPYLKKGDWYGGIDNTITKTSSYLENRINKEAVPTQQPLASSESASDDSTTFGLIILFIALAGGLCTLVVLLIKRSNKQKTKLLNAEREAEYERLAVKRRHEELEREERAASLIQSKTSVVNNPYSIHYVPPTNEPKKHYATAIGKGAAAAVVGGGIAIAISEVAERERTAKRRREEEERSRESDARRRQEQEESDRRRDSSSSYSSSWSGSDSESGWGGSDSGGGFDGGSSGGGGASGDF